MVEVRAFNERGILEFSKMLVEKSTNISEQVSNILFDDTLSEPLGFDIDIVHLETRLEMGEHLWKYFGPGKAGFKQAGNREMWSWVSAAFLPILLGRQAKQSLIGETARWILSDSILRQQRHLISSPFVIYSANYPNIENAMAALATPVTKPGEVVERIGGKRSMFHGAAMGVATELYYDKKRMKLKRNSGTKGPGGPQRFSFFLGQIDLTIDYPIMDIDALIDLLPNEFNVFLDAKE